MPVNREWRYLIIYGFLNISVYLGLYVIAMQNVSAGFGSIGVVINPVFIAMISAVWFKHRLQTRQVLSLVICLAGVILVAFPLLQIGFTTLEGILILMCSMLAYSLGTVFYSRINWKGLDTMTINGWQTLFGGLFLLPVLMFTYQDDQNLFNNDFWMATLWLALPVSVIAVQLWLFLLRKNAVSASYWLFLCPVFGFFIAWVLMDEPITYYTFFGVMLIMAGLYVLQRMNGSDRTVKSVTLK